MLDLRRGRGGGGHTDAALHRHACMQQRQQAVRFVVQEIVQDSKQLGQEFPSGAGAAACISTQLTPVPACSSSAARLHQQCFLCCSTTVSNKATERGAGGERQAAGHVCEAFPWPAPCAACLKRL